MAMSYSGWLVFCGMLTMAVLCVAGASHVDPCMQIYGIDWGSNEPFSVWVFCSVP